MKPAPTAATLCFALVSTTLALRPPQLPSPVLDPKTSGEQTAVLAGGCFWGVEAVYEALAGVKDVVSGYAGGSKTSANYRVVSSGTTGHAESVRITYDPAKISYGQLLKVFFAVAHDPTQLNRQGPDEGPQYRSAIFFNGPEQKAVAEAYIRQTASTPPNRSTRTSSAGTPGTRTFSPTIGRSSSSSRRSSRNCSNVNKPSVRADDHAGTFHRQMIGRLWL